jgi:dihydrodipicolinate synthase/N-acetylneuraminate lyase
MSLGGFIPPLATPLHNGAIDCDSLDSLVDYLRDGVSGYLIGGSVGEHPNLSLDEREALTRAVARPTARWPSAWPTIAWRIAGAWPATPRPPGRTC